MILSEMVSICIPLIHFVSSAYCQVREIVYVNTLYYFNEDLGGRHGNTSPYYASFQNFKIETCLNRFGYHVHAYLHINDTSFF